MTQKMPSKIYTRARQIRAEAPQGVDRRMTFVASDETRDAYGTVLPIDEWNLERYNNNGVVGYAHNLYGSYDADPDYVIGRGRAYIKGSELLIDIEFEPEGTNKIADKVWRKLQFGSLNGVSVGFSAQGAHWGEGEEAEDGANPTLYYTGLELLEVSVVTIPANPNAVRRSISEEMTDIRETIDKVVADALQPDAASSETELERMRTETIARTALLNL